MAKQTKKLVERQTVAKSVSKKKAGKTSVTRQKTRVTAVNRSAGPRRLQPQPYKTLRLQKRIKHPVKLPNVWRLTRQTALTLWQYKGLLAGITLIYGLLNVVLAQGLAVKTDVPALKQLLDNIFTGNWGSVVSGLTVFVSLIGSAGTSIDPTAGAYRLFLALIGSLAVIWALRQALAEVKPRIRDAYYRGMYPMIPFLLVLMVIALQLIPLMIGSSLYSLVVNNGIAVYFVEKLVWILLYGLLALLTFYMVSSSLFALYIVTLPDMTPLRALRSARELVRYRRWTVLRKVLALPLILLLLAGALMLPIIIFLTPLAQYMFFLLTMFALLAVHAYMYTLYRELLND